MSQNLQTSIMCPNLIIIRDNKILLLKRADWAPSHPGYWHVPTGKIEGDDAKHLKKLASLFNQNLAR